MPWMQLEFQPGIIKDRTRYADMGTWFDASLVRFRNGLPEAWSGWQRFQGAVTLEGKCRSLSRHSDLVGFIWIGLGTNRRFYMASDDETHDVTPIVATTTLGTDPLATTNGSNVITVTDTSHGRRIGSLVILSGATSVAGIPDTEINAEHVITDVPTGNTYTIEVTTNANATTTGGGAAVQADYLLNIGGEDQVDGGGWGSLTWGEEEWGGDPTEGVNDKIGLWTHGVWGEDLVACSNKGPIFYWDATNPSDRMLNIRDLPGADGNAPSFAEFIVVSARDRHLLAFGATDFGSGVIAPMSFRWCDQEDILNWDEADTTGTAGSLPLSKGSRFIAATSTTREVVVWSDTTMYSVQYIGAPFIYTAEVIEEGTDIVGLNAATTHNGIVYWMGRSGFFAYGGRVERLPCPVWDFIDQRIEKAQIKKVFASTNRRHSEIIWYYPSAQEGGTAAENDSYVTYDVENGTWSIGTLARTAWLDGDGLNNPFAVDDGGHMLTHEVGADDRTTDTPLPINAYVESAPIELSSEGSYDKGDRFVFIRRILHDVTFRNYDDGANTPKVDIVLKMMDKPGGGFGDTSSSQAVSTAIIPVEEFTEESYVRLRGRSMTLRAQSNYLGSQWRLGILRVDARTDGQR